MWLLVIAQWRTAFHMLQKICHIKISLQFISTFGCNITLSMQKVKSKVKVTEVKSQLSRFQTVTPVWIHIWWWNDAQSLMLLRRGVLLFFKVTWLVEKLSISNQIGRLHTVTPVCEFTNDYEIMHKAWSSIEKVPYCLSKQKWQKNDITWKHLHWTLHLFCFAVRNGWACMKHSKNTAKDA